MAAREGGLVLKEETYAAKRRIIRENPEAPEGSRRQSNDTAELVSIVIEQKVGSSCATNYDDEWIKSIVNARLTKSSSAAENNDNNNLLGPKIPKVAHLLRDIDSNKYCYDPVVVSIGPYHHGSPLLNEIEELKLKWAKRFVADMIPATAQIEMPDLLENKVKEVYKEVENVADAAWTYYDSDHMKEFSKERFTKMMFLDGCFILHFIYMLIKKRNEMGMKSHIVALVLQDLFLLENQIPYIVLEKLMRKGYTEAKYETERKDNIDEFIKFMRGDLPPPPSSFLQVIDENFVSVAGFFCSRCRKPEQDPATENAVSGHHLLDRLREKIVSSKKIKITDPDTKNSWLSFRSAKELKNAGITFKPNERGEFSDVRFESRLLLCGKLILPPLIVDDSTKSKLLNLVALETCSDHGPEDFWVTSYICLMDLLLDTVEDVRVLRSHNILMNYLGSDHQVAELFNEISKNLVPHPKAYSTVKAAIEKHCKSKWKTWVAEWFHTHFSSPWTVLAFLAAILALALSFIQTYVAIKPVKSGP